MINRRIFSSLTLFAVSSVVFFAVEAPSSAAAEITSIENCKKVGAVVRKNSGTFICESTFAGRILVSQKALKPNAKNLDQVADQFIKKLSSIDTSKIQEYLNNQAIIEEEIKNQMTKLSEINSEITRFKNEKSQGETEITTLPSRTATAKAQMDQAKIALTQPQQSYLSLNSQLNALSYEYSSAQRAKASYLSCRVLSDFGFMGGGCGSYNSYYDTVISRYNSLQYQVNSAKAIYDSYNATYLSYSQSYSSLLNSQSQINSRILSANQNLISLNQELSSRRESLQSREKELKLLLSAKAKSNYYLEAATELQNELNSIVSGDKKFWYKDLVPTLRSVSKYLYEVALLENLASLTVTSESKPSGVTSATQSLSNPYAATLDRAAYARGEIATLLITRKMDNGVMVPNGTALASSPNALIVNFGQNSFVTTPQYSSLSVDGKWLFRMVISGTPGSYTGQIKIENFPEINIKYLIQ